MSHQASPVRRENLQCPSRKVKMKHSTPAWSGGFMRSAGDTLSRMSNMMPVAVQRYTRTETRFRCSVVVLCPPMRSTRHLIQGL